MSSIVGQHEIIRRRLVMEGCVQGMGFRPTVYRLAAERCLTGFVANSGGALCVEAEGVPAAIDEFFSEIYRHPPTQAVITRCTTTDIPCHHEPGFVIQKSAATSRSPISLPLPDIATCEDCLAEILDPNNRRHGYAFNNCINCGPRYSIQKTRPYDRTNTSMDSFTMCRDCLTEFEDPANRRFHAQPIACPICGPALSVIDHRSHCDELNNSQLVQHTVDALQSGAIIALKGLGGFQLIADAQNDSVITKLRVRKKRPDKPFAVMMSSTDQALRHVTATATEIQALESSAAPIVLMPKLLRADPEHTLSTHIAPDNHYLGIMLPYTPLHHLLLRACNTPLVVTSGNLSGDPLIADNDEALLKLDQIADVFVLHDRPIVNPVDDSVVQVISGRVQTVRLARGLAPLAIENANNELSNGTKPIRRDRSPEHTLALGGHNKSSIAIATGEYIINGPYIGDLDSSAARDRYRKSLEHLQQVSGVEPTNLACDQHPDYHTSHIAADQSLPTLNVQHHIAHAYACMVEHKLDGPVTCIIWDGTGLGDDGQVWGGECFHISNTTAERRFALLPFALPGGDKAVQEPRRSAIGILHKLLGDKLFTRHKHWLGSFSANEINIIRTMLTRSVNSPLTTSMGRLFDSVASLTGLVQISSHEAHAAMKLEHYAAQSNDEQAYAMTIAGSADAYEGSTDTSYIDWRPTLMSILVDKEHGTSTTTIASRFHYALVKLVVDMAQRIGNPRIVLSGGCFQNRLLTERCIKALIEKGFTPFWHEQIPTNDGGLAFGQAALASMPQLEETRSCA